MLQILLFLPFYTTVRGHSLHPSYSRVPLNQKLSSYLSILLTLQTLEKETLGPIRLPNGLLRVPQFLPRLRPKGGQLSLESNPSHGRKVKVHGIPIKEASKTVSGYAFSTSPYRLFASSPLLRRGRGSLRSAPDPLQNPAMLVAPQSPIYAER